MFIPLSVENPEISTFEAKKPILNKIVDFETMNFGKQIISTTANLLKWFYFVESVLEFTGSDINEILLMIGFKFKW